MTIFEHCPKYLLEIISFIIPWNLYARWWYGAHFTAEETEAQKGKVICTWLQIWVAVLGLEPSSTWFQAQCLNPWPHQLDSVIIFNNKEATIKKKKKHYGMFHYTTVVKI